ncbi:MAG: hypothetical protein AB4062_18690 [Crocosphaera sp.]
MKTIIKSNAWILALSLCLFTLLGFRALETCNLLEANFKEWMIRIDGCKKYQNNIQE